MKLKTTIEFFEDTQAHIREMEFSDANEAFILNSLSEGYFAEAINALEKAEKYRWHDLKKDPKDLPDKDGMYLVCIIYPSEEKAVGVPFYGIMYGYKSEWNMFMPNDGNVIAWKEIEPFEEDEA